MNALLRLEGFSLILGAQKHLQSLYCIFISFSFSLSFFLLQIFEWHTRADGPSQGRALAMVGM